MKDFLFRWASTTFGVLIASGVVSGITFESASSLIWAGLLLGIVNAVLRPRILVLSLPIIVFSLGLFIPVINALLLHWVGAGLIAGFHVAGFWAAFWGGIVISVTGWAINNLFQSDRGVRVHVRTYSDQSSQSPPQPGGIKRVEGRVEGRVIEPNDKP